MGVAELASHQLHTTAPTDSRTVVLLVEDEDRTRAAMARLLRRNSYEVVEAANGDAALVAAALHMPDLAIVDREMPGKNGLEVIQILKDRHGAAFHALMVSGKAEQDCRLEAFDAGADDFIAKPFSLPELLKRVRAAERMHQAYIEARRARARQEELRVYAAEASALLAHDLNNGLAIALCNLDYAYRKQVHPDPDIADAMQSVLGALKRMSGLVSNFTDISRLEDTGMHPDYRQCDMAKMLESVAAIHSPAVNAGAPGIRLECPERLVARLDSALIERVVHNLVGNAMRYTAPDRPVHIRAATEHADGESWLVLVVQNAGVPIPEHVRAAIFDKYATGHDSGRKRGMGLYFCRMACEAHDGTIVLEPRQDITSFRVRLPLDGE